MAACMIFMSLLVLWLVLIVWFGFVGLLPYWGVVRWVLDVGVLTCRGTVGDGFVRFGGWLGV